MRDREQDSGEPSRLQAIRRHLADKLPRPARQAARIARREIKSKLEKSRSARVRAEKALAAKARAEARAEKALAAKARAEARAEKALAAKARAEARTEKARADLSVARSAAKRYAKAYQHVRAILMRRAPDELDPIGPTGPTWLESRPDRMLAQRLARESLLVELITAGEPLEDAVAVLVRSQLDAGDHVAARALCQSLQRQAATRVAGYLGSALVAARVFLPQLAWASFHQVPTDVWRRLAADEYFRVGFEVEPDAAVREARQLIADCPSDVPPRAWTSIAASALSAGEAQLAQDLFDVAEKLATADTDAWAETVVDRNRLRPWLGRARQQPSATRVPPGHLAFAVIDYKHPERLQSSANIGDYIQTVASLGHLVRHQNLRFHSDDKELAAFVTELQHRVRPELRLGTQAQDVTLVRFNRDASSLDDIPPNTWALLFGWHMNGVFRRYDFPPNPNLRPIILSFHCNRPEMLTPATVKYLQTYGPVGCRDWSTVDLLLSVGVPAFFSGCITTTIDTVFPALATDQAPPPGSPTVYVDVPAPKEAPVVRQVRDEVRDAPMVANLRASVELLEEYRRRYSTVVTSRLHCYLPCRSIGIAVEFQPKYPADVRFNGLTELTDHDFASIRSGLLAKLERVLTAIISGQSEQEVYEIWRDACADDVARAMSRRESVPSASPPSFDVAAACATVRARANTIERSMRALSGPEVHVALALDANLKEQFRVVVTAMVDNCTRPLHLWVLCRDHDRTDYTRFAATFPEVTTTWLPCDEVDYGPVLGMLKHITVSTMDRLLLPELLPELDRIIYHDIDALPLGDLARLYAWDLQGQPIAARSAIGEHVRSGFANIMRSAARLRENPSACYELLQRIPTRFTRDFVAFNAGILVLDLAQMRSDAFCREFLPLVERYGMNDQEVLNWYAGPRRAELPPQWNSIPTQEVITDPQIIHWAGPVKPWSQQYVALQEYWTAYVDRLRHREADAELVSVPPQRVCSTAAESDTASAPVG